MKIKGKGNDTIRIAECLLDKSQDAQGVVTIIIYSFSDKSRHPHFPTYRYEESIHEMAKMGLLTVIKTECHSKVVGLEIQRFPYFTVQFSPKRIGDYLSEREMQKDTEKDMRAKGVFKSQPYYLVEGKWGYLKFNKHGEKIKIGSRNSRHFRLLSCLLEPLGTAKTVDSVFEAIRLPRDKDDTYLDDWATSRTRKVKIIQYTIKELQKGNKLHGRITLEFNTSKTLIKAVLLD